MLRGGGPILGKGGSGEAWHLAVAQFQGREPAVMGGAWRWPNFEGGGGFCVAPWPWKIGGKEGKSGLRLRAG